MEKENIIKSKSFQLALEIIELYKTLVAKNEYVMSKQILRSGTSIGANVAESNGAISDYTNENRYNKLINDADEICRILFSILKKTRINKPVN